MTRFIRHYLLAVQFFTRVPVTGRLAAWTGFSTSMLRASSAHLPGVGWLVGGMTAGVLYGVFLGLPLVPAAAWVAAVVSTGLGVLITGAFHEDGLADLADGLASSSNRDRVLEVMKDSRIGSGGAVALVVVLLTKVALLAALVQVSSWLAACALFAGHVISRFMPLVLMRVLPYVGDSLRSKSGPLVGHLGNAGLLAGLLWLVPALAVVGGAWPSAGWFGAVLAACVGTAWMGQLLHRRLQGYTGDALGATQQISELAFYLGLLLMHQARP